MSELYALPNGWEWHRLDEVSTFYNGRAYKKEELLEDGKYRVLRVGNFFTNNNWYYSDLELEDNKYCDKGDLLYAWSASFGPKIWNKDKVIYHYHIWKVVPNTDLIGRDYLFHFLNWDTDKIKSDKGSGATMIHITKGSIEERKIPLPPLTEQQRIVEKLDQLFKRIDKAIVLHQKNIDEADAFMGSALNEVFGELEEKYGLVPIRSLFKIRSGDFLPKKNMIEDGDIDVYGGNGINGRHNAFNLSGLNVIIGRVGALCGNVRCVEGNIWLTDNAFYVSEYLEGFDKHFLTKMLIHIDLGGSANKAAQPVISYKVISDIGLPLPPLPIQQKVVAYLDDLSDKIERVKTVQMEKMVSLKALKASILDKAFRGEL